MSGSRADFLRATYSGPDDMIARTVETLLIRKIPRSFTAEQLLEEVDNLLGDAQYNLVVMPWDHKRNANIGYGFMSFRNPEAALECFCALSGHVWRNHANLSPCRVATALVQGLPWNLARHVSSKAGSSHVHHEPIVFDANGMQMDLDRAVRYYCSEHMLEEARRWRNDGPPPVSEGPVRKAQPEEQEIQSPLPTFQQTRNSFSSSHAGFGNTHDMWDPPPSYLPEDPRYVPGLLYPGTFDASNSPWDVRHGPTVVQAPCRSSRDVAVVAPVILGDRGRSVNDFAHSEAHTDNVPSQSGTQREYVFPRTRAPIGGAPGLSASPPSERVPLPFSRPARHTFQAVPTMPEIDNENMVDLFPTQKLRFHGPLVERAPSSNDYDFRAVYDAQRATM